MERWFMPGTLERAGDSQIIHHPTEQNPDPKGRDFRAAKKFFMALMRHHFVAGGKGLSFAVGFAFGFGCALAQARNLIIWKAVQVPL